MKIFKIIFIIFFLISFRCADVDQAPKSEYPKNFAFQHIYNSDTLFLSWAPPLYDAGFIKYYEVYYHTSKDTSWKLVKSNVPATDSPKIMIARNEVDANDNVFYFAVLSVTEDGEKSEMHKSTDTEASPCNWIVNWY
ncbi:MAG: fibronectin type III domain-containing protein [Fibrobacter sp.]|nr:fibronectin type III domain-containing protein [Fibrobacter sp.]